MSKVAIIGNTSGTGVFTVASPNSNTDRVLTLPDETGTVLTGVSSLVAGNLTGSVPTSAMPAGSVLQVKQNIYDVSNSFAISLVNDTGYGMGGWHYTGVSLTFTPTSATSRIILSSSINFASNNYTERVSFKIVRDTGSITPVTGMGAIDSNKRMCHTSTLYPQLGTNEHLSEISMNTFDEPNTISSVVYKVYVNQNTSSGTVFINRPVNNGDAYYIPKAISTITGFEVAQ
jgi:hypothetical protein